MIMIKNDKGQMLCYPGTTRPYYFHLVSSANEFIIQNGISGGVPVETDEEGPAVDEEAYQKQNTVDFWLNKL